MEEKLHTGLILTCVGRTTFDYIALVTSIAGDTAQLVVNYTSTFALTKSGIFNTASAGNGSELTIW